MPLQRVLGQVSSSPVASGIDEALEKVRENITIDCTIKEIVRTKMRAMVSRVITNCGYPPELCEKATRTVWEWSSRRSGGVGGRCGAESLDDRWRCCMS